MQLKPYAIVLAEMMDEYDIDIKTALRWDTFGIVDRSHLHRYFKAYGCSNEQSERYVNLVRSFVSK